MLKWLKRIQRVLEKEPETWLAYLDGQQIENIPRLRNEKTEIKGAFPRFMVFLLQMLRSTRLKGKIKINTFFIYAGTENQQRALESTLNTFKQLNCRVTAITKHENIYYNTTENDYEGLYFSPLDVLKTTLIITLRFRFLRRELKKKNEILITNKLNTFFSVYAHLVYFERLLRHQKPDFILISNDHNPTNRALLAIADTHSIDTVYMQHASVSTLFPALNVKLAFLDGQAAADVYRQCEANHPPGKPPRTDRQIFLSGQKKILNGNPKSIFYSVGVAFNKLDNPDDIDAVLSSIQDNDLSVRVRWHPSLKDRKLKPYLDVLNRHPHVDLSNPKQESVADFLGSIKALISGNSSIHFEAALSNVVPVYYEFTHADNPDYYGYVKHGLALQAKDIHELMQLLKSINDSQTTISTAAVQHFSATYGTEWEGREGEFVVRQILIEQHKKQASKQASKRVDVPHTSAHEKLMKLEDLNCQKRSK